MKKHKWKYDVEIGELVCEKCGICKMKCNSTGEIIYIDFKLEPYYNSRSTTKRPECK